MGYRLDIVGKKTKKTFYGTKLYGYTDEERLRSYQYLIGIGKFNGDEYFSYCNFNEITLDNNQFKEFIKLYNEDYNNDRGSYFPESKNFVINNEEIQELLNSDEDKIVSWG